MFRLHTCFIEASLAFSLSASAEAAANKIVFGPFHLGDCHDCEDVVLDKSGRLNVTATFDRGDFDGIWGTGGVAHGSPVEIEYDKGAGEVWFVVTDLENAIMTVDPGR